MNKDLDSFTVERLEEFIRHPLESGLTRSEQMELARIALAAKRAEPVGYLEQNHLDYLRSGSDADIWPEGGAGDIPVYLTPQLNSPEIPDGWIKCSDQMPEDDTLCLGVDECGVIWTMHFDDGEFRADTGDVDDLEISHWMPLPAAPEKENG
ncbi:TPA: DUF551 domain-containing protein [Yersinia enterocolitica]|nr:DUF551 domain-containing protein [Yersinia enterocolitica]